MWIKLLKEITTEKGTIPAGDLLWLRRAGLLSLEGKQICSVDTFQWDGLLFIFPDGAEGVLYKGV